MKTNKGIAHLFLLVVVIFVAIGAVGYLAYQNAQLKKQSEDTTPTPESVEQQAGEPTESPETADWETYINNSNKYSIKIPLDWEVETISEDKVRFYPPGEKGKLRYATSVTISVFSIDKQNINNSIRTEEQYKEWVAKPVSEDMKKNEYKIGQMKIDGLDGIQLVQQTLPSDAIGPAYNIITWIQKDNKNFYIYLGNEKATAESLKSIYNQILSTFKFLDESDETTDWKTYTNTKYGFSTKYPPDFFITQMDSIKPSAALSSFVIAPEKHKDSLGSQIPMLTLTVHNNSGSSLLDWFRVHATKKKFDDPSVSMKDSPFYYREYTNPQPITFDGKEGINFSSWTMNGEVNHVLLITPDQNYILDWGSNENFRLGYKKTFDQILSTLKFTE